MWAWIMDRSRESSTWRGVVAVAAVAAVALGVDVEGAVQAAVAAVGVIEIARRGGAA